MTDHQENKIFEESKEDLLQHLQVFPFFFRVTQDNLARTYWCLHVQWTREWTGRCGNVLWKEQKRRHFKDPAGDKGEQTHSFSFTWDNKCSVSCIKVMNKRSDWNYMRILLFQACFCKIHFLTEKKKKEDSDATRISISKHMLFWRHAKNSDLFYVSYFVLELFEMCTAFYKVYML